MKKETASGLLFILVLGLASGQLFGQSCDNSTINLGTINSSWIYTNPDPSLRLQLPDGWYVYDYLSSPKKYLRVGSNYFKISMGLSEMSEGSMLDLGQLKKFPLDYAPILLSLAILPDTSALVPSDQDSARNHSFSMRVYYAESQDEGQFLQTYCKKITGRDLDSADIKDTLIGAVHVRSTILSNRNKQGEQEQTLLGVKKFGCVHVLFRFTYQTGTDLQEMLDICKGLKSAP